MTGLFQDTEIRMETTEVLRAMGYGTSAPGWLEASIEAGIADVASAARPRVAHRRVPVRVDDRRILVGENAHLESVLLRRVLGSCTHVVVFVATLGPEVDRVVRETDDVLQAYVLDTVAALAAESTADGFHAWIERALTPGEGITRRYSPGYCDWPLAGQSLVFGTLDAARAGVSLNNHFMMSPKKSISGVVGVGPREAIAEVANACEFCHKKDCDDRRP